MTLEEIKGLVEQARFNLEQYNALAEKLAEVGVTIELDTSDEAHGVVGIGKVIERKIHASFALEL